MRAILFKIQSQNNLLQKILARPAGLEPATLGLEGRCSIRLSYGRVVLPVLIPQPS